VKELTIDDFRLPIDDCRWLIEIKEVFSFQFFVTTFPDY